MIHTLRQFEFLPVATPTACLRSIGRIDLNYLFTSIFRFVFKCIKKHAPGGVSDTFVQGAEFPHIVDLQVLYDNGVERVNELSGLLMSEVMTFVGNPLVNSRNNFSGFSSLGRAFNLFGEFTLRLCQSLLFLAEKSGIFYGFPIRKSGEVCHAHIESSDGLNMLRDRNMLNIAGKGYKPFSGLGSADRTSFNLALDRPVFADSDAAYFRELNVVILKGETTLRVAKRVVSKLSTEAWIARFIAPFYPLKESSEGEIDTGRNVLKGLAEGIFQKGMFLLKLFNSITLIVQRKTYLVLFPSILALFKKMVVEPSTGVKRCFKRMFLCAIRIDSIFESFSHVYILTEGMHNVKLKLFV